MTGLKTPSGKRQPVSCYKHDQGFELKMTENKASYCSERDSNPGQLDWEDRGQRVHLAMLPAPLLICPCNSK